MTIGLFSASVLGMNAQSHSMGQISTNIANVNTVAYKRSETSFKTVLGKENLGKNNFLGVTVRDRRFVEDIGQFTSSEGQYDLAINGRGFFIVSDSLDGKGAEYYTRAGNFRGLSVIQDDNTTINNYLGTDSGHYVMGWLADENGNFDDGAIEAVRIDADSEIAGEATANVKFNGNIPGGEAGNVQEIGFSVYGHDYDSKSLSAVFTQSELSNNWTLKFLTPDGEVTSPEVAVRFDGFGNLAEPATPIQLAVNWDDGGANNMQIDISSLSQLGKEKIIYGIEQDGKKTGTLVSTQFTKEGVLVGSYSNGIIKPICKLAQADFVAPNNLEAISGNLFKATMEAGEMVVKGMDEDNGYATTVLVNMLENSNVDLVDQFSKMVITQKAYSTSATAFKTTDEMLQEASNLKR